MGALIDDPVARHRRLVAFLQGDRATARKFADEAIAYYQNHAWTPRQAGAVMIGIALFAGAGRRGDEALKLAHEAYEWQLAHDVFSAHGFHTVHRANFISCWIAPRIR